MKVAELQAVLARFVKLHREGGASGKAKALEDFSSALGSAKDGMTVQALVKKVNGGGVVGKPPRVR